VNVKILNSFTELDLFRTPRAHDLLALLTHFEVPDAFVGERLNSVTHSFGNYEWDGIECKQMLSSTINNGKHKS
jgi:hypothetical protein